MPQSPALSGPLVAFDFDGTLTVADSFTAFLRWRAGPVGWLAGVAALAPATARYLVDRDRGRIKAAAVSQFLDGVEALQLSEEAERFADQVWDRFMRPDALACWEDWGRKGAHRVIVTASPALTVAPFARRLGAEALLGTELALDADGRVTGAFVGENCRGEEKVERLIRAYGPDVVLEAAYGDTSGDAEMLARAAHPGFRRFRQRP
ncbi:MAG: HAD-IB family hydrolase [Alphaproteobacteria bacterium]|nr:HAD-IB family hydrolase [Alphaproteobacteria bacterium]